MRWSRLPNSRIFSSPQKESLHPLAVPPHPPSPYLVPSNHSLPLVSVDLLVLDILYKWNHMIDGLLCPAFTWCNVFPPFSCDQHFVPFYGQVVLHCNGYTTFLSLHSSLDGHLGCFCFLAVTNNPVNNCVQVSIWTYIFSFLGTSL